MTLASCRPSWRPIVHSPKEHFPMLCPARCWARGNPNMNTPASQPLRACSLAAGGRGNHIVGKQPSLGSGGSSGHLPGGTGAGPCRMTGACDKGTRVCDHSESASRPCLGVTAKRSLRSAGLCARWPVREAHGQILSRRALGRGSPRGRGQRQDASTGGQQPREKRLGQKGHEEAGGSAQSQPGCSPAAPLGRPLLLN